MSYQLMSAEQALTRFNLKQCTCSFGSWMWDSYLKESAVLVHEGDLHLPHDLVLDWHDSEDMGDFVDAVIRQHALNREHEKPLYTFVVNGSLTVDGVVLNADMNGGAILLVTGGLNARSVVGGGSEICIAGPTCLSEAAFGHSNDGTLAFVGGLTVPLYLNDDNDMYVHGKKKVEFNFDSIDACSGMAGISGSIDPEEDENGDALLPVQWLARLDPDIADMATLREFLLDGKPVFRRTDGQPVDWNTPAEWLERVEKRWQRLGEMPRAMIDDAHVDAALAQSGLAMRHVPESMQTKARIHAALTNVPDAYWLLADDQRNEPHAVFAIQRGLHISKFPAADLTQPMCDAAVAHDPAQHVDIPSRLVSPCIVIELVMRRQHPRSFPAHWDQEKLSDALPAYLDDAEGVPLHRLEKIASRLPSRLQTPAVLAVLRWRLGA